ncbi:ParB N-terminal domain-containing protein [Paenibacillus daejeonensis]|uniref:ParB N-terminal domain-containing protein n=1 Tax=Paenibacillus daejeonensis TaxID=135193 RepID=UPI00037987EF|nr:ParB N-terminal domain-containing protein [Paenibacillus daejeonensis]
MRIVTIPIEQINAAAYHPRADLQPGDPEYEQLSESIEAFGYVAPIIWNERTGNMVGGHQRLKILRARGDTEVAVSVVALDERQEQLLNLALNKVQGSWNDESLASLLQELMETGDDVELSGFKDEDIKLLLSEFTEPPADQLGDFKNKELDVADFDESKFDCKCPRCGFVFNRDDQS